MSSVDSGVTSPPKIYKALLVIVLLLLIGLVFKLKSPNSDVRSNDERYPSLYCAFHQCPACSSERIIVDEKNPVIVFDFHRECLQWVMTPRTRSHTDNLMSIDDLGYVMEYVDSQGTHIVPILPHQQVDLGSRSCGDRGCEFAVSGIGKCRIQLDK